MKAYMVFEQDPENGCLLIFAETANKARYNASPRLFGWEYIYTSAIRKPDFDQFYTREIIIETNYDLPKGAPNFYDENYFD